MVFLKNVEVHMDGYMTIGEVGSGKGKTDFHKGPALL